MAEISLDKSKGPFHCLGCDSQVLLHQGDIRKPYFRHKPSMTESPCNAIHKAAIEIVVLFLRFFQFNRKCCNCDHVVKSAPFQPYHTAKSEVAILEGKYRADVAVFNNQKKQEEQVIEVYHTHLIGKEKRLAILGAGLEVYEVSASDVLEAYESNSFQVADLWDEWKCDLCTALWQQCREMHVPCHQCRKQYAVLPLPFPTTSSSSLKLVSFQIEKRIGICQGNSMKVACSKCLQRPCLGCQKWQNLKTMKTIEAPPFTSKFPFAYICSRCEMKCQTCGKQSVVMDHAHCGKCQREAAELWRRHRGRWKQPQCMWPYGTDPPSMAQLRSELFTNHL